MMYKNGVYYFIEKEDEIVIFDKKRHCDFKIRYELTEDKNLKPLERLLYNFFYEFASETWNEEEHHPDHDVAIVVSVPQLIDFFNVRDADIYQAIEILVELNLLGVVLLKSGTYAYHVVL